MWCSKKIWITSAVILGVAVIGTVIAVTLVFVLDTEEDQTTETPTTEDPPIYTLAPVTHLPDFTLLKNNDPFANFVKIQTTETPTTEDHTTETPTTEVPQVVCEGARNYAKIQLKAGQISHLEKPQRHGPPPIKINTKARASEAIATSWINQRVDHFDPTNLDTWQMRYMSNDEFHIPGGPIFIFLGGEWEISDNYLRGGQMYDMAEENRGYMFYTEHRYYGMSYPTEDLCTYNLKYNSADQALADVAYFIEYQKSTNSDLENSKVVVVGGSYSAMLATWMRIKYPHLVDAALSSSAPLRAVADFYEYYEVVGNSLKLVSEECVNVIAEAYQEIDNRLQSEDGVDELSSLLNVINRINTTEPSRSYFLSTFAGPFAGLVQYASGTVLEDACSKLLSFQGNSFNKFIAYINDYYEGYVMTDYAFYVSYLSGVQLPAEIYRSWLYQTCTEYGFYQTASSTNQPFKSFGLDLYLNMCKDVYGVDPEVLHTGIERTNLLFGSITPEITNVVSTHGTVDPWHPLGVLEDLHSEAPVFVVEGASHCADLASINEERDSERMIFVKTEVKRRIAEWISAN